MSDLFPLSPDLWRGAGPGRRLFPLTLTRASPYPDNRELPAAFAGPGALLESGRSGRYAYFVPRFEALFRAWSDRATIAVSGHPPACRVGPPLEQLQLWLAEAQVADLPPPRGTPPFRGGAVGLISYDLAKLLEPVPSLAADDLCIPLLSFGLATEVFAYDHKSGRLSCTVHVPGADTADDAGWQRAWSAARERAEAMHAEWLAWTQSAVEAAGAASADPAARGGSLDEAAFVRAARRAGEYIASGDSYQINLSVRRDYATRARPDAVYRRLRRINPSPFMGLLRLPEFALVCGSPELLVQLHNGRVETRPIAGTRRRGEDLGEDAWLQQELSLNEKERAEHLMLVDLMRNDLGRICSYGSVHVPEFMAVERYSHVMHLVSQVEGKLAAGKTWLDVIRSVFPGGTITGAPKVRTMQIIEELEPVRRGAYTGSLGWVGFDGAMQFNIVIRSILMLRGQAHIQAGAGIVADSDPDSEYRECMQKALAMHAALAQAEGCRLALLPGAAAER